VLDLVVKPVTDFNGSGAIPGVRRIDILRGLWKEPEEQLYSAMRYFDSSSARTSDHVRAVPGFAS
jgi:hypothetical protein